MWRMHIIQPGADGDGDGDGDGLFPTLIVQPSVDDHYKHNE